MAEFYKEPKKSKEYKISHLVISLLIVIFLLSIIIGTPNGNKKETTSEGTQEKVIDISSTDNSIKVGKTIWRLRGVIDEGWVLKENSKIGQIYEIKKTGDSKLIGVILEYVNFTEIMEEIRLGSSMKSKGANVSANLVDSNGKRFKELSYDELSYILPYSTETRLDDIYRKYMNYPDSVLFTFFYSVPINTHDFKVEVRDETNYSNEKALIDLGL